MGSYDTRTSTPEDILKIAEIHGKNGVSAIVPTIYSDSIDRMRENMEGVRKAMEIQSKEDMRQKAENRGDKTKITKPSKIIGLHLEGPFLNPLRSGALDKGSFLRPNLASLKKLIDGYEEIIKIITVAPELPGALKIIERCREIGFKVNMGHSDATYKEAIEGKRAGATGITHLFNAMRPFHHRDPGIAGLALIDDDLYIEVIADGIHLSQEVLKLVFNIKRSDRIIVVSDSIKGAGNKRKPLYKKGVLIGSTMVISEAANMLRQIGLSESIIRKALIENPKRYLR
ncbi:MAG: N-acetylglucosamine-6-phosphate deacetylase [Thermodesulfovibrionales bacterium]